jgi:hypothetical protein
MEKNQNGGEMSEELIYIKTPKGIEEMNKRTYGLPQKTRLVLIMMDGKCDYDEILSRFPDGEGEPVVARLVAEGFIAPLQTEPTKTASGKTEERFEPPKNDAERFEMAKNLMRNTINAFLGGMGSGLTNQIDKCSNLEELRQQYGAWQESIHLTGDGRKQAADLEKRLAALLS